MSPGSLSVALEPRSCFYEKTRPSAPQPRCTVNVYVADRGTELIQKFDANGVFITKWGGAGQGDGLFASVQGLAADIIGNVYVADANNHRIQKFAGTCAP